MPTITINSGLVAQGAGTVDVITATFSPAFAALTDKMKVWVISTGANTSATPSFSPDGLTARTIVCLGGTALEAGDIGAAGFVMSLEYNLANTRWELLNPNRDRYWKAGSGVDSIMDRRASESSADAGTAIGVGASNTTSIGQAIGFLSSNSGSSGQAIGEISSNSGEGGQALGNSSTNISAGGQAIGTSANNTSGAGGQAIGNGASNTADNGQAFGDSAANSGTSAQALGNMSVSRISNTTNISGAIIIRKDNSEVYSGLQKFQFYSGADDAIFSEEVNLKSTGTTTVTLPTSAKIFVNEVGVIVTSANTVSGQPTISYGNTGNNTSILPALATTGLTVAAATDKSVVSSSGLTSLTAEVTVAATGTTLLGRFYWQGKVVEDE